MPVDVDVGPAAAEKEAQHFEVLERALLCSRVNATRPSLYFSVRQNPPKTARSVVFHCL